MVPVTVLYAVWLIKWNKSHCSRVSLNHLYGPSSLEKWSPPKEEDTQVASQEEEEEELFPAAALHALLYRSQQQQRSRRRQWPFGGGHQRQQVPPQQRHRNQHSWCRSWNRSNSCLEACRAIRDACISWGLLQVSVVTTGVGCLGGPGKEPVISCSRKTNSSAGAVSDRGGVCDCAHTCTRAWLHHWIHWDGRELGRHRANNTAHYRHRRRCSRTKVQDLITDLIS